MIKTSCFSRHGTHEWAVSIAIAKPKWCKCREYKQLAPTHALLKAWRAGELSESEYEKWYLDAVLNRVDPEHVLRDLDNKILLCHEKPGDFCHRRLASGWLELCLGIQVPEIVVTEHTPEKAHFVNQMLDDLHLHLAGKMPEHQFPSMALKLKKESPDRAEVSLKTKKTGASGQLSLW